LIRITDDGCGMSRDDAMLAFERHATSKLRDVKDLLSIATLGFRGEALPSIASVSRLRLETCAGSSAGIEKPPLLAKDARSGAPLSDEGAIEVKINVKGNGQECPFQTSKVNNKINVKSGASGVRVPTFRKRGERWGSLFVVLCSGSQNPRPFGFAQGRLCPSKERRD
jgi:hypothetical protein